MDDDTRSLLMRFRKHPFGLKLEGLARISYRQGRRIAIFLIGSTVMLIGVVMLVTPGPAFVVIPLGLAILTIEFAWARRWMARLRAGISRTEKVASKAIPTAAPVDSRRAEAPRSGENEKEVSE